MNNVGIVTARDNFTIHSSKEEVENVINDFLNLDDETARTKYQLGKDVRDWQVNFAKKDLITNYPDKGVFTQVSSRPFDIRWTFYTGKTKGFHCYPRNEVMKHLLNNDNISLITNKPAQGGALFYSDIFVTKNITDQSIFSAMNRSAFICPLYLYPEKTDQQSLLDEVVRTPNLNMEIVNQIGEQLGLYFNPEELDGTTTVETNQFTPLNILDYIYAVLHSPNYREKYKEFLKIDFPRVPYPSPPTPEGGVTGAQAKFWQLVALGGQLRQLHLLESETVENYITQYPEDGDNIVGKLFYEKTSATAGKVYINFDKTPPSGAGGLQYFDNVPEVAWNFYIGGYQPAQKWLKDRKERELSFEDILHYQKIIVALSETDRIMKEIDTIEI